MQVAKRYVDESDKINCQIRESHEYFLDNIERYNECRSAVYNTSLTDSDTEFLSKLNWPQIEFPILKPYISRLRGEWSKQTPSITVNAKSDQVANDDLNDFLENHIRAIIDDANKEQFEDDVFSDTVTGGFSVMKVSTEYESDSSFNQVIKIGRVFNPTLCFFDPLANKSHKGDGEYCGEHFPMHKDDVEEMFNIDLNSVSFSRATDGFNWYYQTQEHKIALVCHFYNKKYKTVRKVLLANGVTITKDAYNDVVSKWTDVAEPPAIVKERDVRQTKVCRYTLVGGIVREYVETDYSHLPLVFVDGDSAMLTESGSSYQRTVPYIEAALGVQRMKNISGQALLNEIMTMMQQKVMMPIDAFPEKMEQAKPWLMPQVASVLLYNQWDHKGQEVSPPTPIFRQPIPPEIPNTFVGSDDAARGVLSIFDPNEGINNSDLSGKAIVEAATQSNAVAMPYVMNYMAALTQASNIILDLIPKYFVTPRTVPVIDSNGDRAFKMINSGGSDSISTQYDPTILSCLVEASVNFEVQRQRDLELVINLSQSMPAFGQLMSSPGAIDIILQNIDIRGIDKLKDLAEKAAQTPPPPNPQMQAMQLKSQEIQGDQQYKMGQLQLQQQKMQMDAQNQGFENQIKSLQVQISQQQLDLSKYQTVLQAQLDSRDQTIQIQKAGVEQESDMAKMAIAHMDMSHNHNMDIHDRLMGMNDKLNEHSSQGV